MEHFSANEDGGILQASLKVVEYYVHVYSQTIILSEVAQRFTIEYVFFIISAYNGCHTLPTEYFYHCGHD